MSRICSAIALTVVATSVVSGCNFEPATPELVHTPNENALALNEGLERDASAQAQLDGALRMLFGTPGAPAFYGTEDWADEGFFPGSWTWDEASDEFQNGLMAQNREDFADQLAFLELEQALPSEVDVPSYALDLQAKWQEHLDYLFDEDGPDGDMEWVTAQGGGEVHTWLSDAQNLFIRYYPDLATTAETYRQQCYHCHGASGGGDGSTVRYLNPLPRDYRPGIFKFTALNNKAKPRHEDLMHTLEEGIYTTAMPSFKRLPKSMLAGLADYVRLLAIRGETELLVSLEYDQDRGFSLDKVLEMYDLVVGMWREGDSELIVFDGRVPAVTPEAIERGRALFMSETGANCIGCHGAQGRGNGVSAWETDMVGEEYVKDDWKNEITPRDLTRGIYRFGRRPIDLYRRIYAGINGTPMPAHFDLQLTEADGSTRRLVESDLWDLVAFVRALPSMTDPNWQPEYHGEEEAEHGDADRDEETDHDEANGHDEGGY